jgi:hypothetical protein
MWKMKYLMKLAYVRIRERHKSELYTCMHRETHTKGEGGGERQTDRQTLTD